jgi:hypothetical protein
MLKMQASVTRANGKSILKFTKPFDAAFTGSGAQNFIAARGPAGPLGIHQAYEGLTVNLVTGSATVVKDNKRKWRRAHSWLMGIAWGIFIPLGVASAMALRSTGPLWCVSEKHMPQRCPNLEPFGSRTFSGIVHETVQKPFGPLSQTDALTLAL